MVNMVKSVTSNLLHINIDQFQQFQFKVKMIFFMQIFNSNAYYMYANWFTHSAVQCAVLCVFGYITYVIINLAIFFRVHLIFTFQVLSLCYDRVAVHTPICQINNRPQYLTKAHVTIE